MTGPVVARSCECRKLSDPCHSIQADTLLASLSPLSDTFANTADTHRASDASSLSLLPFHPSLGSHSHLMTR